MNLAYGFGTGFLEIAFSGGKAGHQRETARDEFERQLWLRARQGLVAPPLRRWRHAGTAAEERAEAAEAGETDRHADLLYGKIGQNEQVLGALDLSQRAELVGCFAEHGAKEPDEVMGSDAPARRAT
jgi:hypothetical protein